MKSTNLFTSMLALTAVVAVSCSAPRLAQQNTNDDVYNSQAQAREYRQQVPVRQSEDSVQDDEYYGASDPYYDMDYSSRINRFYNNNMSWRGYYDPYFDGGWYGNYGMSLGLGFGYNPFYGSIWNSPYYGGWGNYYSPFWYNNWGWNNWGWNNYYGGGYYGGGYWGGGFYTGRTTNVPDYRARPSRGSANGYNGNRNYGDGSSYLSPRSSSRGQSADRPVAVGSRPSRGNTVNTGSSSRPATTESTRPSRGESTRPTRESYTPPPTYNPPPSRGSSDGGSRGGGSYGGGSSGGTTRPSRGGGR